MKKKHVLLIILVGLILINIPEYYGPESYQTTGKIVKVVHGFMVSHNLNVYNVRDLNMLFRKISHFCLYTFMSFTSIMILLRKAKWRLWSFLGGVLITFSIACSDELLQTFIPGRTGMFVDVLLDSTGIVFGMLLMIIVVYSYNSDNPI